jgi:AcrR family transcriptional regulator
VTSSKPAATSTPRTGRRQGPTATREAIVAAAREAFAAQGYTGTSLREVARRAGVDPSLIVHFYGSKAGLLSEVIQWPFDVDAMLDYVLADGSEHIGERLAQRYVEHWEQDDTRSPVIALLHAAIADPNAASLMGEYMSSRMLIPLMRHIDADRPALRAGLIASQLLGFGLGRYVLAFQGLTEDSVEDLTEALGTALQRLCTEPLRWRN